MLSPKHLCRVDDYSIRSKLAFDVTYGGHHLLLLHSSRLKKKKCKPQKRKGKREYDIVAKIVLKKKKRKEEKARFLCNLEMNDLHMKHINACKNKYVNSTNNTL